MENDEERITSKIESIRSGSRHISCSPGKGRGRQLQTVEEENESRLPSCTSVDAVVERFDGRRLAGYL